ncbi:VasL domain-containing protein [Rouxiella sp. WC2420]|uniref:VasL domain-containing protein n=1 Tax=Rouxiella sp. WC2420 TaxID=3234145 RepID=A0AB39VPH1_9GAMM
MSNNRQLRTGGDPRTLADYAALHQELSKLTHPARPDVNWKKIERLSLSLFQQNGIELQTASWFTQARMHLTGLSGLCEGLGIIEALLSRQWAGLWPLAVHARVEILSSLSQRLQQRFRSIRLEYHDLPQVYHAEKLLNSLCDILQRLELKNVSQLGEVSAYLHNAAMRLENNHADPAVPAVLQAVAKKGEVEDHGQPWIYMPQTATEAPVIIISPEPTAKPLLQWWGFVAGIIFTVTFFGAITAGAKVFFHSSAEEQVLATLQALPAPLNPQSLESMRINNVGMLKKQGPELIAITRKHINYLADLSPLWPQDRANKLVHQVKVLWPEDPEALSLIKDWTQQLKANAIPTENLPGWHSANLQLQKLADKLNELDEERGHYMTVSQLKTSVFAIQQALNRAIPVEESLRKLDEDKQANKEITPQRLAQLDNQFRQLLNRYGLMVADFL